MFVIGVVLIILGVVIALLLIEESGAAFVGILMVLIGIILTVKGCAPYNIDKHWVSCDKFEIYRAGENGYMLFYWYKGEKNREFYGSEDIERIAVFKIGVKNIEIAIAKNKHGKWKEVDYRLSLSDTLSFKSDTTKVDSGYDNILILEQ